ncbi:MAG: O-antigen ligase family protein [Deltaproteobacteria bacterium]|nr:O-antigen ligase family protein [Deltaproteobacteria bacterium]
MITTSEGTAPPPVRSADSQETTRSAPFSTSVTITVLVVGCTLLEVALSPLGQPRITFLVGAVLLSAFFLQAHLDFVIWGILGLSLALSPAMTSTAFESPLRVYYGDLVLLPAFAIGILVALRRGGRAHFQKHFVAILGFAMVWTALGTARGLNLMDAVGVARRVAVYPTIFVVASAAFHWNALRLSTFKQVTTAAGIVVAIIGFSRLANVHGFAHALFEQADQTLHFLAYAECPAAVLALFVVVGDMLRERTKLVRRGLFATAMFGVLVASNYRTVWAAALIALLTWMLASRWRVARAMKYALLAVVAGGALGAGFFVLAPESRTIQRFSADNLRRGTEWRTGSWRRALEVVADHPITGTGFGYQHTFQYRTGPNFDRVQVAKNTVHNDVLWILTNGGLLGALIILGFHARWVRRVWRALRSGRRDERHGVAAAILATYVFAGVICLVQPLFSDPGPIVSISLLMAIALHVVDGLSLTTTTRDSAAESTNLQTARSEGGAS